MTELNEVPFRVERRTHRMVKRRIVRHTDTFDSKSEFASQAVEKHAGTILNEVTGGDLLQDLIELLGDVEGITEDIPSIKSKACLGKSNLERYLTTEITNKTLGIVDDVQDETGLSCSTVCRMCLFNHLYHLAEHPTVSFLHADEEHLVLSTWAGIESDLVSVESKFHEILHRRFVRNPDTTLRIVEQDNHRFERFANRYCEKFAGTSHHKRLIEHYGERTFRNVENVIEEVTGLTPPRPDPERFLESALEEARSE